MKTLNLPGSKSITNRDFILASLTEGTCKLSSALISDDTLYMIKALKKIGIDIEQKGEDFIIKGGISKLKSCDDTLYIGQSGTCMRFLTGLFVILALKGEDSPYISGEERLLKRPLKDLLDGIKQMGLEVISENNYPPVKIKAGKIKNNKIKMNGTSSSQFFTALLNIAPLLENGLEIEVVGDLVSKPYIDLTIEEIRKFGANVENYDYKKFKIKPQKYKALNLNIEGDASALSYIVNYIILHGGEIKINNIGKNTKQGDYNYLNVMKKYFDFDYEADETSTILKANPLDRKNLKKLDKIDFESMPDVSMSFMTMAIFLSGKTKITGLQTLNLKESKRIDAMANELKKLGIDVEFDEKSITIGELKEIKKGPIDIETYNDHRIAMVFGTLNTYLKNMNILNPSCVKKTYPKFWEDIKNL